MVLVADCHDPAEATVIRTILSMHGIDAVIPEGASSAGVAAVGFITHVFVPRDRADEARELIAELRSYEKEDAEEEPDEDGAAPVDVAGTIDRRKKIGAAVLFAILIQWGTGHMSTGAWKRGFALAAVQFVGARWLWNGDRNGLFLWVGAIVLDVVGAVMRCTRARAPLPQARVRVPGSRGPR